MYPSLRGKRVVVTGAASGIGLATAVRFLDEDARVAAWDVDAAALDQAAGVLGGAVCQTVDVGDADGVGAGYRELDARFGGVDVLVANAGISIRSPFLEITPDQWLRVMRVNLDGVFHTAQGAARRMVAQGGGAILMTASTNGLTAHPLYADYNASKAGVILLARTLALELAPAVRVNAVCPGYVLTPMQRAEYTDEMLAAVNRGIPLQRHAAPEEVAALFAFLASEQGAYITGQAIPIDGGELA